MIGARRDTWAGARAIAPGWLCAAALAIASLLPAAVLAQIETPALNAGEAIELFEPLDAASAIPQRRFAAANTADPVRVRVDRMRSLVAGQRVEFPITVSERWAGVIQRIERRSADSFSLFGSIPGTVPGWFIFTVDGGGLMAVIEIPDRNLYADLRNLQGDDYAVCTFDADKAGRFTCGTQGTPGAAQPFEARPIEPPRAVGVITPPNPQHDVLVLYTQGLVNDFPNHFPNTPLNTAIQLMVDFSNQSYVNSGVLLTMRLAYRGLVDPAFSEAGKTRNTLLNQLTSTSDGVMDQAHTLRTTYHADIVCLLYSIDTQQQGGGGLAWLLDSGTFATNSPVLWYGSAFCVVEGLWEPTSFDPPLGGEVLTEFTHEIGHTQGMDHNCEDTSGTPVSSYAYGWRFTGNSARKYVDIMAYRTGAYVGATLIPYFGNPSIFFDGQPTGTNAAGCGGTTTGAKTAVAMNLSADFMSRLHLNPLDPWVDFNWGGSSSGRFDFPWISVSSAVSNLPNSDAVHTPLAPTVTLKGPAASGTLPMVLNKRMIFDARGGAVRIGGP